MHACVFIYTENKFYYGGTGSQQAYSANAPDVFFTVRDWYKIIASQTEFHYISFWKGTQDDMIIETDQHLGDVQVVGV